MSKRGWFAIDRAWFDHESFEPEPYTEREAFAWLVSEAATGPRTIRAPSGRGYVPVRLERGELCHSYDYMASRWGWTYKEARTFLIARKRWGQIGHASGKAQGTELVIISITNYDTYQAMLPQAGTLTGTEVGTDRAHIGQQEKQLNNLNKNTRADESDGFPDWYFLYPRKKQRHTAARAFTRVTMSGKISPADLMARTKVFAATWVGKDLTYCLYPASWLNSGAYLDQADVNEAKHNGDNFKFEAPTRDPGTFTEAEWRDRCLIFRSKGQWSPDYWGPPPGEPGCLVPTQLLSELRATEPQAVGGVAS